MRTKKWIKAVNIPSSLSNREKILRKALSRLNDRSISFRRWGVPAWVERDFRVYLR